MKNLVRSHLEAGFYSIGVIILIYSLLLIAVTASAEQSETSSRLAPTLNQIVARQAFQVRNERVEATELVDKKFHWKFEGDNMTGHLYKPKGDRLAAVLVLPGQSGQVTTQTKVFCEKMRRKGYVVLALDLSEVSRESAVETSRAIAESLGWMEELVYVDSARIGIVGDLPGVKAEVRRSTKSLPN
ncbi:MAG: alpha/beta hydrolase [Bdellovibrionaceae bacterium]|nr:alpha/beta hydrolase [Bdellovibrionales bacterium]MCB9082981.1 alpha/beta hydrolase [Pseudobdellovibrionaceae bacterium]